MAGWRRFGCWEHPLYERPARGVAPAGECGGGCGGAAKPNLAGAARGRWLGGEVVLLSRDPDPPSQSGAGRRCSVWRFGLVWLGTAPRACWLPSGGGPPGRDPACWPPARRVRPPHRVGGRQPGSGRCGAQRRTHLFVSIRHFRLPGIQRGPQHSVVRFRVRPG